MKFRNLVLVLSILVLFTGCIKSPSNHSVDNDGRNPLQRIQAMKVFQKNGITIKKVIDRGDLYQVQLTATSAYGRRQNFDAFVTKNYNLSVIGKGFNKAGKELIIPVNMKKYEKYAAFRYGHGKKIYYVFTDPECPYCKRFEEELRNNPTIKDKATLYFFFYPLPNHPNAEKIAIYALSQSDDDAKFDALTNGEWQTNPLTSAQTSKYKKVISLHKSIANSLGLKGTPTVFDSFGKFVSWPSLLR